MRALAQPVLALQVEATVFFIVAIVSVGSAVGMVFMARNTVHAAMLLVANFFTLAVMYVLLDAHFLAAVQVVVYAGAIMVLFLFVIMLIGDRPEPQEEPVRFMRPVVYALGAGLFAITSYAIRTALSERPFRGLDAANQSGNTEEIGRLLFTKYLFPFEIASILLIIAAVGAMIIGRRRAPGEAEVAADEDVPEAATGEAGIGSPDAPGTEPARVGSEEEA